MSQKDFVNRASRWRTSAWICLIVVSTIAGCSAESPCLLSGQVTFDGSPVPDGNIRLNPIGDTPGSGGAAKIVEGKYEISLDAKMLAGKHEVLISATRSTGRQIRAENMNGGPSTTEQIVQYIPERYNTSTELLVDLEPGENTANFDLRSD